MKKYENLLKKLGGDLELRQMVSWMHNYHKNINHIEEEPIRCLVCMCLKEDATISGTVK